MTELKKILYVDDDKDIQLIVKVGLDSTNQFDLTICSSGAEALQILSKTTPDLLLLDVMMPEMDGPSLVKEIRKRDDIENIPYMYITAKAHPNDVASLLLTGAISVITKPFNPINLGNEIQKIWNKNSTLERASLTS